jgi:hypothetical protein
MGNSVMLTPEQIARLCERVRGGSLTADHVGQLVALLDTIGSSIRVMSQAEQRYPFQPERQDAFVASAWDPTAVAYVRLVEAVA